MIQIKHDRVFPIQLGDELEGFKVVERFHNSDYDACVWLRARTINLNKAQFQAALNCISSSLYMKNLQDSLSKKVREHRNKLKAIQKG